MSIGGFLDLNGTYIDNITLPIDYNEADNRNNVSLDSRFNDFIYNTTEDIKTTSPTSNPTGDINHYESEIIDIDSNLLENN